MSSQNKPRLADMAKKNTTDRASKLVNGFLPPVPKPSISTTEAEPAATVDVVDTPVVPAAEAVITPQLEVAPKNEAPQLVSVQPETPQKPVERKKRSQASGSFVELVTQPFPAGLRCDKPIMVAADHHQLLRQLSFVHNKPMTEILYNLLEAANQSYQRDQHKDA